MPTVETGSQITDWLTDLPVLGSGLGFRPPWMNSLVEPNSDGPKVDFREITADHYLDAPRWKLAELGALRESCTLIPHALDLSLGSAEGINEANLDKLAALVELTEIQEQFVHLALDSSFRERLFSQNPTEENLVNSLRLRLP